MTRSKIFKSLTVLFIVVIPGLTIFFVLVYKTHPIILKWMTGTARIIGKPVKATVYTDGYVNTGFKIYRVDRYWHSLENGVSFIVSPPEWDSLKYLKYFRIDTKDRWIGIPAGTSVLDYDVVFGRLFQSETGGMCTPFQDDMKGFGFDPHLEFTGKQIRFNIPPHRIKYDSIRIELE